MILIDFTIEINTINHFLKNRTQNIGGVTF